MNWKSLLANSAAAFQAYLGIGSVPQFNDTRVAVIGAGAAGSSFAYHLSQYNPELNITIYEKNDYIGGRVKTIEIDGETFEQGGAIFVAANSILSDAAREFNFTTDIAPNVKDDYDLGVWDGSGFVFELPRANKYLQLLHLVRSFGLAPYWADRLREEQVGKFLTLYSEHFPFEDLQSATVEAGIEPLFANWTSASEYFANHSISQKYQSQIIEALTRVNYATDLHTIHPLAALVCLEAQSKSYAVEGGNNRIFQEFVKRSNANVLLERSVDVIARIGDKWSVDGEYYDYVVLATPWAHSTVNVYPSIAVPKVDYTELHVTHVLSPIPAQYNFFGSQKTYEQLVTLPSNNSIPITSIGHARVTKNGNHVYKLFSYERLSDEYLTQVLGIPLSAVWRKQWYSYPVMAPTPELARIEVAENLFYTSGMDPLISTMETNALAGKNVARLIANRKSN